MQSARRRFLKPGGLGPLAPAAARPAVAALARRGRATDARTGCKIEAPRPMAAPGK